MTNLIKSISVLTISCLCLAMCQGCTQNAQSTAFEFPEGRMGKFIETWYEAVNNDDASLLNEYRIIEDGWEDQLGVITSIVKDKKGIAPVMISYHTEEYIAVYSKFCEGRWVIVNLGLNEKNEILAMGIRKCYKPEDYDLKNKMSVKQVHRVIDAIAAELAENYVLEDKRTELQRFLLEKKEAGDYDEISQGDLLAKTLSRELVKFADDKHLQVIPPSMIAEVESRFGIVDLEEEASDGGSQHLAPGSEDDGSFPISGELLAGNIGYVKMERFVDSPEVIAETDKIMARLAGSKALIIDLTQSGGGDAVACTNLLSYFFETSIALNDKNPEEKLSPNGLSNTYANKPLYVLTSKKSISAAEAFAYFLQRQEKAMLIGETTAGAGYRVDAYVLPFQFYLVNSIGSGMEAAKNEGWQGSGVIPEIKISARDALKEAISRIDAVEAP